MDNPAGKQQVLQIHSRKQFANNLFTSFLPYIATVGNAPQYVASPGLYWIRSDSKGDIWFNEAANSKIGKFTPSTGELVEFSLPKPPPSPTSNLEIPECCRSTVLLGGTVVFNFAIDQQGNVWYAEFTGARLGMIDASLSPLISIESTPRKALLGINSSTNVTLNLLLANGVADVHDLSLFVTSSEEPTGEPNNMDVTFSQNPVMTVTSESPSTVTMKITTKPGLKTGDYNIAVNWKSPDNNNTYSVMIPVTVASVPPLVAHASADSKTAAVGTTINFDASASTSTSAITSYEWDFGDGTNGTGIKTTHAYTKQSLYTVTLTITDQFGNTATDSITVNILESQPQPTLSDQTIVIVGLIIVVAAVGLVFTFVRKKRRNTPKKES